MIIGAHAIISSKNSDLDRAFLTLGAKVGPRTGPDKRTKDEKEWDCLADYLQALAAAELLRRRKGIESASSTCSRTISATRWR